MHTCPNQHESQAADFCSVCGVEMAAPAPESEGEAAPVLPEECPQCRARPAADSGIFCEGCGYNFRTGAPGVPFPELGLEAEPASALASLQESAPSTDLPAPVAESAPVAAQPQWELLAVVDLSIGDTPAADAPRDAAERVFPLERDEQLIGRRSARRNIHPEIALDGDDGVSHRHANVVRQQDGTFALLDLGSSNGTALNGVELKAHAPAPLQPGDQITLGRWTRLTVRVRA